MAEKKPTAAVSALATMAALGVNAIYFPLKTCDVCGKPIESGTAHREVRGIGRFHPECDPRERKEGA